MRRTILGCVLLLTATLAQGGSKLGLEATLTVTGTISVDAEGNVTGHSVDHPESLDPGIVTMIDQVAPRWRFEPVAEGGRPVPATAAMRLSFVADAIQHGGMTVRISAADFRDPQQPASDRVSIAQRAKIVYPEDASRANIGAAVYIALRIDHNGNVDDAVVRNVDLFVTDAPLQMRRWREKIGNATLKSVRQWTFHVPTTGPNANDAYVTGTLPVVYDLAHDVAPAYGQWLVFVPGPVADISWLDSAKKDATNAEALAAGAFAQDGSGLKLLTPLGG